jgi:hypothetical protein
MVEAAGVGLDRVFGNRPILQNLRKNATSQPARSAQHAVRTPKSAPLSSVAVRERCALQLSDAVVRGTHRGDGIFHYRQTGTPVYVPAPDLVIWALHSLPRRERVLRSGNGNPKPGNDRGLQAVPAVPAPDLDAPLTSR